MKNTLLIITCFYLFSCCTKCKSIKPSNKTSSTSISDSVESGISRQALSLKNQPISFMIKKASDDGSEKGLLINLEFKNMTSGTLKLLDQFSPLGIFFSITIISENGKVINVLHGGKADFSYKILLKHITIPANKSYVRPIDLKKIMEDNKIALLPGIYTISMVYHNQYGVDCVQGSFKSNEIKFRIL